MVGESPGVRGGKRGGHSGALGRIGVVQLCQRQL